MLKYNINNSTEKHGVNLTLKIYIRGNKMKTALKKKILISLICSTMFTFTACGGSGSTDSKQTKTSKKVINVGIMNAPSGFNPLESSDVSQNECSAILFQPLVGLNNDLKFVPMLADSIETKDNQNFTIKINDKAKWTDGKPVTTDDVIFTFGLIANPKVASSVSSNFNIIQGLDEKGKNTSGGDISGIKKVDDHTLTISTKAKVDINIFNDSVSKYLKTVPQHVLKDVAPDKLYQSAFIQKPDVTDGPFKLVTYQKDQYVQFDANKDYFKGAPKLDQLFFKIMPGANITVQLQSGEIDMNDPNLGLITFQDYDKVKAMSNLTTETKGPQSTVQTLMINVDTIKDPKMRKAISAAINRDMVITKLLKGDGETIESPYISSSTYIDKSITATPYDPEKAKQLIKESGWDTSKVIRFDVPSGNTVREQVADIITENLKSVGLNVKVEKYDFVTSLAKAKKHDFDIYIVGIPVNPVNPDLSSTLMPGAPLNLSNYNNPALAALLKAGINEIDMTKRKDIYNKIQAILAQDLPCPSIYVQNSLKAVSKRVTVGKPKEYGMYLDLYQWDVQSK